MDNVIEITKVMLKLRKPEEMTMREYIVIASYVDSIPEHRSLHPSKILAKGLEMLSPGKPLPPELVARHEKRYQELVENERSSR